MLEQGAIERRWLTPKTDQQWKPWAEKICAAFQKTVASIIEIGRLLNDSKETLGHGSFEAMVESKLPFTLRTARMFMAIAEHPVISNRNHVSVLPAAWSTLYQITRLPLRLVEECIEDGRINPKLSARMWQRSRGNSLKRKT
jgi:hypothetical protein